MSDNKAIELKNNLEKYLVLSVTEGDYFTGNDKVVTKRSNPHQESVQTAKSLFGILPVDAAVDEAKRERLSAK